MCICCFIKAEFLKLIQKMLSTSFDPVFEYFTLSCEGCLLHEATATHGRVVENRNEISTQKMDLGCHEGCVSERLYIRINFAARVTLTLQHSLARLGSQERNMDDSSISPM